MDIAKKAVKVFSVMLIITLFIPLLTGCKKQPKQESEIK